MLTVMNHKYAYTITACVDSANESQQLARYVCEFCNILRTFKVSRGALTWQLKTKRCQVQDQVLPESSQQIDNNTLDKIGKSTTLLLKTGADEVLIKKLQESMSNCAETILFRIQQRAYTSYAAVCTSALRTHKSWILVTQIAVVQFDWSDVTQSKRLLLDHPIFFMPCVRLSE